MKKTFYLHILAVFAWLFVSCESWEKDLNEMNNHIKKDLFGGYVQKGPFIRGSGVTLQELDNMLNQTGKTFTATIFDNTGNFEYGNIGMVSKYAQLKADGYYFNEVTGKTSAGQISLFALVDMSESGSANINVLTHLEHARVEYLVKEAKKPFAEAKKQAQKEALDIFCLNLPPSTPSESIDLTDNAILLAVSCILQGALATGELVELMANIIFDIRTDGTLDNPETGARLVDNAVTVSLPDVRRNLENKYAELDREVTVPDFEQYVRHFLENTPYK